MANEENISIQLWQLFESIESNNRNGVMKASQ
jgi:hypothetical protein